MNFFTRRLTWFQHLSDETLSRLLSGELSALRSMGARSHIRQCWRCRLRHDALDKAAMRVTEYRRSVVEAIPSGGRRREMLVAELRKLSAEKQQRPHFARAVSNSLQSFRTQMTPLLASVAIVVSAVCLLMLVWRKPAPVMNASQLLDRAALADHVDPQQGTGVIYQKVSIATPKGKIEHEIYRDLHAVRRRRPENLTPESKPVQETLSAVGVEWQAPLSAESYREWHDRQPSVTDQISKTSDKFIKLSSTVANGPIREESLTVRTSDFHAVERTVESRDYGTIEIAEVNYAVLDWSGVNEALFEPLATPPHPSVAVALPALPTSAELDNAELSARLVLNRLHADEGEQISVSRNPRTVEVKGVVETAARKAEIVSRLAELPHVAANVLSMDELQTAVPAVPAASSGQVRSVDAAVSPLEKYLTENNRRPELESISRGLLDASLKAQQNAAQYAALRKTFPAHEDAKNPAFTQLAQSYSERLQNSLSQETAILESLGLGRASSQTSSSDAAELSAAVDRNADLCRELITGNESTARSATAIVPDLYKTIAAIRLALNSKPSPETR